MKFVLAPFAFAAFAAGAAPAPNLVVNPDFETRDAEGHAVGWERLPSNYKVADNAGENGSRGLVFENDDPDRYQVPFQKVPCEPGAEYRFSVRVKTERLVNVKGQDPCATACLQWSDAEGREFGGKYVQGIFDTQGEWRTVECHSARIPTNAVEVRFSPYVTRGVTGRACFDGITLSPVVRQPVAGLWSSAYRDCAAEGKVTFVAGLDLAGAGLKLTDMLPLFRIYLADGKTKDFAPELFTDDEARFTCDVSALPRGKSAVVFELRERRTGRVVKDGQALVVFDRAEKLPARKVWFDASNRLIVDGKPFFPLGMYMNMAITGAVLDVYAKGPFNCLMNYTAPDEKAVDICWKHGLKVLYPMPSAYAGEAFATDIDADAWVADRVRRFKDHPALLAWYVNDERGLDYVPRLKARQEFLKTLDPDHPTWAVLYQIDDIRHYMGTCDAIGTDPYPIGSNNHIAYATQWAEASVKGTYGIRPVWQVPQAFDWGAYWKNKNDVTRMPSRDEMANMFWQAVAAGANGLIAYSYTPLEQMDWKTPFDKSWGDVCAAAAEVRRFIPVLLSDGEPPRVKSVTKEVTARAWRDGAKAFVLAVNTAREEAAATVEIAEPFDDVKTEFGPAPTSCGGGKLEARLPPLGRAIWRIGVSEPPKPAEVLVSREGNCVERWRAAGGRWTRAGIFLDGSSGVKPAGIAAAGGAVYVADLSGKDSGRIVKFAPDGKRIGVLAETPYRPDQLCVSPDGRFLYVSALHANTVLRYALADGKGGAYISEKLAGPRMLAFGPDGCLHVACRASNSIAVWDVASASPRFVGKIGTSDGQGGLAFAGADGATLVVPGRVSERIDLAASRTAPLGERCVFSNAFAVLRLGGSVCAGDYISGIISRLPEKDDPPVEVASGLRGVCALLDLTGALDGSTSRRQAEESRAFKHKDKGFVYDTPLLPGVRDLERMAFNNPDAVVDLSCGIWPNPFVYDYDGDADLDVVISYRSVPSEGTYFFENPTPKGTKCAMPVFKAAVPGDNSRRGLRVKFPPYRLPVSLTPHFRRGNGGGWHYADLTGDGRADAVYAISDWAEYGCPGPACPVAYDADGNWTNNQLLAYMYLCRNLGGEGAKTVWGSPEPLLSGGRRELQGPWGSPLPHFHDWDGDGDLDFITSDFISEFWYFENAGTKEKPVFAAGRRVMGTDGMPLEGAICMMSARKVDWDGDGRPDIVAAEEDGRVAFCRNTGKFADGAPVFEPARFFRQKAAELKFGCLATPWGTDWDGDGDWDLVCGNSEGRIAFIENLSGPGVENPKWAAPKLFTVSDTDGAASLWLKGKEIRALCGPSDSPQGPAEQKWGYTVLSVADWDGDGYLDIMANDVKGSVVIFRNPGKKGTTVLESPKSVEVEWEGKQPRFAWEWRKPTGKDLRAPWRTTPCMHDWNRDGLTDLVMLDHEGFLCLYERAKRDGRRVLLPPQRIFCDDKGNPLALAARPGGGAGRRKFCIADWDGDGKPDLIMNGVNAYVFRQVGAKGGKFLFKEGRSLARKALAGHTCCPAAVDFNADGTPDLVIGAEDGNFYYLHHP